MTEEQAAQVVELLSIIEERLLRIEAAIVHNPQLKISKPDQDRIRRMPVYRLRALGHENA